MAPFSRRLKTIRRPPRDSEEADPEQAPEIRSEMIELKQPKTHHRLYSPAKRTPTRTLVGLPQEIQLLIFQFLDFGEIEALRRTCRHFKSLLGHEAVIDLFGSVRLLHDAQLATCCVCLQKTEAKSRVWVDPASDQNWPLASKCISCAYAAGDLVVDKVVTLGDWTNCNICRWCGRPVDPQPDTTHLVKTHEFHDRCWGSYRIATIFHICMGVLNFSLTFLAGIFIWARFQDSWQLITASVLCLALLLVVGAMQLYRTDEKATMYHIVALLHIFGLVLWSLAVAYYETLHTWTEEQKRTGSWIFPVVVTINIFFRVLDILGNILFMTNYKPWMHKKPHSTALGLLWREMKTILMIWTWPRCVEYSWPPERYWFPDNMYGRCLYRLRRFGTLRKEL